MLCQIIYAMQGASATSITMTVTFPLGGLVLVLSSPGIVLIKPWFNPRVVLVYDWSNPSLDPGLAQ